MSIFVRKLGDTVNGPPGAVGRLLKAYCRRQVAPKFSNHSPPWLDSVARFASEEMLVAMNLLPSATSEALR